MRNKDLYNFIFSFFFLLLSLQGQAQKKISISSVSYHGSGCPEGSVYTDISPDEEIFTLSFNNFTVSKEGPRTPYRQSKDCTISLNIKKPKNLGFKFLSFSLEGAGDLEENLRATQILKIKTKKTPERTTRRDIILEGPYADNYERSEEFDLSKLSWASCGKKEAKIKIKTKIFISPSPGPKNDQFGFMSVDQAEGYVKEKLGILWERCSKKERKKTYLSTCKLKVYNTRKNKLKKDIFVKKRGKSKEISLKSAREKAKRVCEKIKKGKPQLKCNLDKLVCKTQTIN